MPDKTITLTDEEVSSLDVIAAERGVTADELLQQQAQEQINDRRHRTLRSWFESLPLADKQRLYDTENA